MSGLAWALAALGLGIALGTVLWARWQQKRLLEQLNRMLDEAINGDFNEAGFDETLLSATESRMVQFLAANHLSSQKLAEEQGRIKTLIGDISHQTKTPVANLLLYSQLLAEKPLPPDCREAVRAIGSQAEKLHFLIDALVKLSRLENGIIALTPQPGPVGELLAGVVEQAREKAAQKQIDLQAGPTEAMACFDEKWTLEALYNLVDNAIKYTPAGGSVRVTAQNYELFCRIDVADTGVGIPKEEHSRVFDRFYRGRAVHGQEGVGIGLFLTRQILAGQGGYIKVTSEPGKGATFSMFLPRGEIRIA